MLIRLLYKMCGLLIIIMIMVKARAAALVAVLRLRLVQQILAGQLMITMAILTVRLWLRHWYLMIQIQV